MQRTAKQVTKDLDKTLEALAAANPDDRDELKRTKRALFQEYQEVTGEHHPLAADD
jgi:hypothetical protein